MRSQKPWLYLQRQWPHASYVVAGGVSCDPSYVEIMQAKALVDEVLELVRTSLFDDTKEIRAIGDLHRALEMLQGADLLSAPHGSEHFLALADTFFSKSGEYKGAMRFDVDIKKVKEIQREDSKAKEALYDDDFVEVGPLARALINQDAIIMRLQKEHNGNIWESYFCTGV